MVYPDLYDYKIKCLVIGDYGVGKSSMINRFCDGTFENYLVGTAIGLEFRTRTLMLDEKKMTNK